jgi:putative FmdB family regulatory protein
MPFYEFRCMQCGEPFEVQASFAEKAAGLMPECPKCHSKEIRQVITAGFAVLSRGDSNRSSCCSTSDAGSGCCG